MNSTLRTCKTIIESDCTLSELYIIAKVNTPLVKNMLKKQGVRDKKCHKEIGLELKPLISEVHQKKNKIVLTSKALPTRGQKCTVLKL